MPEILQHFEGGDKNSQQLIVFLQGWPDNAAIWEWINWKADLNNYHLLFMNFPNTNGNIDNKWGKDFPLIVQDIKATIDSINAGSKKKTLVAHDWGCFYGYMFDEKNPGFFSELIMMDVPAQVSLTSKKQILSVVAYQMTLLIAFLLFQSVGKYLTQKVMVFFKHNPPYFQKVNSCQNYPYYYMYRNKILSALKIQKPYLASYKPSGPVVYLYAQKKPFQFHGQKWLKTVKESGGEIHGMDAGHWFMKKYSKFITDLIIRRITKKG